MFSLVKNILVGALVGVANVVPGISGGTIIFIFGLYPRITGIIANFFEYSWDQKKKEIYFCLQLAVGVFVGIILFGRVLIYYMENYREQLLYFFMGLTFATGIMIYRKKNNEEKINILYLFIGIILFLFLTRYKLYALSEVHLYIKLLIVGFISGATMLLPGISGSLMLLLLGEYENTISYLVTMNYIYLFIFGLGAVAGILSCAKIMNKLLSKYFNKTISFILGLIITSLIVLWPGFNFYPKWILLNVLSFLIGVVLVLKLNKSEATDGKNK